MSSIALQHPSRERANANRRLLGRWIANRVIEILGSEDDVVIELIFDLVEGGRHVSAFLCHNLFHLPVIIC